jgi:hypothetical protein
MIGVGTKSFDYAAVVCCSFLLLFLSGFAYCQDEGTALMLQLSPAEGGRVNLGPGVHIYDRDADVTLKAIPNPGYQFVYWIGCVTEATASTTTVCLDSPKIVIAVFERSKFKIVEVEEKPQPSVGGGGLRGSAGDYAQPLEQAGGGRRPPKFHLPRPPHDVPVPEGADVPVPEGSDVPIPEDSETDVSVPEPATGLYLLFSIFYLRKRAERRLRQTENKK